VAALVFAIGEIPYLAARAASPPEHRFGGVLQWVDDLNMYFSFIRQAADGRFLFANRLTHLPHDPAFFNPEFLAVGLLMRFTGASDTTAFAIWRAAGILALVLGFTALLWATRTPHAQRSLALLLFLLGGGLGWLALVLGLEGPRLDLDSGFQPFAQMLLNPHFSLPHGLVLLFLASWCRGEQEGRTAWYAAASLVALLEGLIRPYDLLTLWIALPAAVLMTPDARRTPRSTLPRALPLLATLPALAYFVLLFRTHPAFRHWASQAGAPPPSFAAHAASLGLMGLVGLWRLARWRSHPLGAHERPLLAWLVAVFAVVHSTRLVPWLPFSPQAGTSGMAPVVLLALPALPSLPWSSLGAARWALAGLLAANCLSSAVILQARTKVASTHFNYYHLRTAELDAFAWLARNARASDVILANYKDGNRLGRFVSSRVVLGHYSVTPASASIQAGVEAFLAGALDDDGARRMLADWNVRWVYYSPRAYPSPVLHRVPWCARRYRERGIAIYECEASQESPKAGATREGGLPAAPEPKRYTRTVPSP
jgi:hypothetical protein